MYMFWKQYELTNLRCVKMSFIFQKDFHNSKRRTGHLIIMDEIYTSPKTAILQNIPGNNFSCK